MLPIEAALIAAGCRTLPPIVGYERDLRAVGAARENLKRASLGGLVRIEQKEFGRVEAPESESGLVGSNPPYGDRTLTDFTGRPGPGAGFGERQSGIPHVRHPSAKKSQAPAPLDPL